MASENKKRKLKNSYCVGGALKEKKMKKSKWYSCSMENSYQVTCFVFKARSEEQLVKRINKQKIFGWYYDGCLCPVKEIDYRRAKELIDLGAHYVWW